MTVEWSGILSKLKTLKDVGEKNNVPEISEAVMELQRMIIELQEDSIRLLGEIDRLKKDKDLPGKLSFMGPYAFLEGDTEPHCRRCYDVSRRLVHMGKSQRIGLGGRPGRMCPECKGFFRE